MTSRDPQQAAGIIPAICKAALACLLVLLGSASPAGAHPHAWIDVSVDVLFDPEGRVTALRENWLFDEYYTAAVMQKGSPKKLDQLRERILRNLKDYGYFTRVQAGDRPVALAVPAESSARIEGNRLLMSFTAPLAEPVDAARTALTYAIFDPTYFIEMLHEARADAIRLVEGAPGCRFRLIPPNPDPKAVAAASMLDRTQTGGDGLGVYFAEKVEIRCDPLQ